MHYEDIKGTLFDNKIVIPLRAKFFDCCNVSDYHRRSHPFGYPSVTYFKKYEGNETLLQLNCLANSEDGFRVHFKTSASGQRQITTAISYRGVQVNCRRVGQDKPDDLLDYGIDATWVRIDGKTLFFVREDTQVKPVHNPTVVNHIRQSAEGLLKEVEVALKL